MGIYRDHVLPRIIDVACGTPEMTRYRERVTEGLSGTVVEIGFGSGRTVPHYPAEVTTVYAVEPAATARRLAEGRIAAAPQDVHHVGLRGEEIPLDDASCDAAVSVMTMCTIPDVATALAELQRVLRPGGELRFVEHGISPDEGVVRWQRRLEPAQRRLFDGCHLTRDAVRLVTDAGFELVEVDQQYGAGPRPWMWFTLGRARRP